MNGPRNVRNNYARPFLKWAGGKSSLVESYDTMGLIPCNFEAYYEPFLGGGAMFFHLYNNGYLQEKILLSDINKEVINLYSVIKEAHEGLIETLKGYSQSLKSSDYYKYRDEFNDLKIKQTLNKSENLQKAALMLIINKTCYNGLYRENKDGLFNVPFGKYSKIKIFDEHNLKLVSKALTNVELRVGDYSIVQNASQNDFVYFDPPYHPLNNTSSFTNYAMADFDTFDQKALAKLFFELSERGVKILLSNSAHPYIQELYEKPNINIAPIKTVRHINCKGDKRKPIVEYAITNFTAQEKSHQSSIIESCS